MLQHYNLFQVLRSVRGSVYVLNHVDKFLHCVIVSRRYLFFYDPIFRSLPRIMNIQLDDVTPASHVVPRLRILLLGQTHFIVSTQLERRGKVNSVLRECVVCKYVHGCITRTLQIKTFFWHFIIGELNCSVQPFHLTRCKLLPPTVFVLKTFSPRSSDGSCTNCISFS